MIRRRLASCALALVVCHAALIFAVPASSCCPARSAPAVAAEKDCCPAGSHPPGQCPLHRGAKPASSATCRLQCDAPHGAQFLLGAVGVLPAPAISIAAPDASIALARSVVDPATPAFVPDSPPPRLL